MATAIKFERDTADKRDFRVIIDGEHRATFRSNARYHQTGYDLHGPDGESIRIRRVIVFRRPFTKANFEAIVREVIADGAMPTRAQIERALMIEQAEKENREHDSRIAAHWSKCRREVMRLALARYINDEAGDADHIKIARQLIRDWEER